MTGAGCRSTRWIGLLESPGYGIHDVVTGSDAGKSVASSLISRVAEDMMVPILGAGNGVWNLSAQYSRGVYHMICGADEISLT